MEGSQINVLRDCEIARQARDQEIKYLAWSEIAGREGLPLSTSLVS